MSRRKLKVLLQTDFSLIKTGFGRNAKDLLSYLYLTDKYDLVHYCVGVDEKTPDLKRTPWKSLGCLPNDPHMKQDIQRDPKISKIAHYGAFMLDDIIRKEKPDIYIAAQDIWGVDFAVSSHWFNKITSVIWTTLDSLPILPSALAIAPKVKNYWLWSDFATQEMHRLGHRHVKTLHGIIDTKHFFKIDDQKKAALKAHSNIPQESYIIGYVFRNQLRKSVPNLLEGYKLFKEKNANIDSKLLLHTDFREGWDLKRLADEHAIPWEEIITTHICDKCLQYEVKPYRGPAQNCRFCGSERSVNTTGVTLGVTESELNEVYNLMDVYCHPFTSGGQEIPIQEAKLTELVTLVTNYSCGEEMCRPEANSLPLKWSEYREFGTNFIKASTEATDICDKLTQVYEMSPTEKSKMGKAAREWALRNFSVKSIGKKIEAFLDSCPLMSETKFPKLEKKDPQAIIPETSNDVEWIITLYDKILKTTVDEKDEGLLYWMSEIKKGVARPPIENYFRNVAAKDNVEKNKQKLADELGEKDIGKRILYVIPEKEIDVFLSTSLFESIQKLYPDHNLYVATKKEYASILNGNDYIYKVLEYTPEMDTPQRLRIEDEELFNIVYTPHLNKNNYKYIKKSNF